jgi:hypothetical protein
LQPQPNQAFKSIFDAGVMAGVYPIRGFTPVSPAGAVQKPPKPADLKFWSPVVLQSVQNSWNTCLLSGQRTALTAGTGDRCRCDLNPWIKHRVKPANCFQAKPVTCRKARRFLADLPLRQTLATAADVKHWLKTELTE